MGRGDLGKKKEDNKKLMKGATPLPAMDILNVKRCYTVSHNG